MPVSHQRYTKVNGQARIYLEEIMENFIEYWDKFKQNGIKLGEHEYFRAADWFAMNYKNLEKNILMVCCGKISPEVEKSIKLLRKSFEKLAKRY